jgi:hypothetical protein
MRHNLDEAQQQSSKNVIVVLDFTVITGEFFSDQGRLRPI